MNGPPKPGAADLVVFADATELAEGAAARIASFIGTHVTGGAAARTVTVAMAGGTTPAATYRRLAGMDVPWERVCAWVGDERYVPPEHPDSNGGMVGRLLLDTTPARFLRVPWKEGRTAARAAALYETELMGATDRDADGPRPDLVLAGMGGDGHTLSLFPDGAALDVEDRWYVADRANAGAGWRLTATYPLVHRARQIYVLVTGKGKAAALAEVLEPSGDVPLPARRLMDGEAPVTWLVDEAAASRLGSR